MPWTLTHSLDDYLDTAGGYLRASAVEHTVELSAAESMRARGMTAFGDQPPLFGWWNAGGTAAAGPGAITAAMFHTPPYPVLLSGAAEAIGPLAEVLAARPHSLPGVNGAEVLAAAFAAQWQERTGAPWELRRHSRLFTLGDLADPVPMPPGAARLATPADAGLVLEWLADFAAFIGESAPGDAVVADWIGRGGYMLWIDGGRPVALAGRQRPAAGVVRVGPVYTPPDCRRRGYGGAVTAAVSRAALAAGASEVVLFTDLANPTSNALYPRLGYRPVADRTVLEFGPPATSASRSGQPGSAARPGTT